MNSDSPAIPPEYLRLAVDRLAPGRIVLGPAADGGYYAVGIDRHTWSSHKDALRQMLKAAPMGTPALLSWTLAEARRAGLQAVQLPLWLDVDEAADLPVFERLTAGSGLRGEAAVALGLREVYLHVTNRCGCACLHCYNRANPWEPGELTTAEWRRAIDDCVALGATSFVVLGGDPLLREDLRELIEHVTGRHGLKARLFFNSPITPGMAAELAAAGHGRLRPLASIDGPEEIHDALRYPGNHAAVLASIANLLAVGLEPVANTVLLRSTLPGLPVLARELERAGVTRLHLILPHQRGGLPENLDLVPSGDEMLSWPARASRRRRPARPGRRQPGGLAPPTPAATGLLHGRLPGPGDRPLRQSLRLHDHRGRSGLRGRRPAARLARAHLAIVAGAAPAARRAGAGPGRVRRLSRGRRLRRRVLDAGPLRGPRARSAGRPGRAFPVLRRGAPGLRRAHERAAGGGGRRRLRLFGRRRLRRPGRRRRRRLRPVRLHMRLLRARA